MEVFLFIMALVAIMLAKISYELMEHSMHNLWTGKKKEGKKVLGPTGPEIRYWWNSNKAYKNKNKYKGRNRVLHFLLSTVLVWTTDAEHFFQMLAGVFTITAMALATLLAVIDIRLYVVSVAAVHYGTGFMMNEVILKKK